MGYVPKRICSRAGCNNYATHGAYCEEHTKNQNRNTTSEYTAFYGKSVWKKARKTFLTKPQNIWCENCLKQGIHTPSQVVHHRFGFNDFATFMDTSKWVAWCSSCHSSYHTGITNKELFEQNKNKW